MIEININDIEIKAKSKKEFYYKTIGNFSVKIHKTEKTIIFYSMNENILNSGSFSGENVKFENSKLLDKNSIMDYVKKCINTINKKGN